MAESPEISPAGVAPNGGRAANVMVVVGEPSADRYAARFVSKLRGLPGCTGVRFYGTGGDQMAAAGVELLAHVRDLASIGPREAVGHLRRYYATYRRLIRSLPERRPAAALLCDFPDFNLPLAKKLKRAKVPVVYYISPQLWAWRRGRVRTVRDCVDKMLVILPFEAEFYRRHGVAAEFVGHPLLEDFAPDYDRGSFLSSIGLDPGCKTVALLPGSRWREVEYMLPVMIGAARQLLDRIPAQFVVSAAPSVDFARVCEITGRCLAGARNAPVRVVSREARDIVANSDFALVKSGTSTLEAALVGTPFVVTYRISRLSWQLGNILVRSPFKGLINLIAQEEVVPELMQHDATPENLARTALKYLSDPELCSNTRHKLAQIKHKLSIRCASDTVAAAVRSYVEPL